ncbi:hypothetical protein [Streptomyces sp. NPDC054838]
MDDRPELSTIAHRARTALWPPLVAAACLTAAQDRGLAYRVGATGAWALAFVFLAFAAAHQWDICSHCEKPPRQEATPEARLRLARLVHPGRAKRFVIRWSAKAFVCAVVLPKPYLNALGPWRPAVLAPLYLLLAAIVVRALMNEQTHERHRDECFLERCRAGQMRVPHKRWQHEVGHHALWVLLPLIPAVTALGMAALSRPSLEITYALGVLATLQAMNYHLQYHSKNPCMVCARRIPANGSQIAERPLRKRMLRTDHLLRLTAPVTTLAAWTLSWVFPHTWAGRTLLGAAAAILVIWLVLGRAHSRLQPWCPWCRDCDGDEEAVDPSPVPGLGQPLPA